jgi:apolipoprotein N-acyltransferase
VGALVCFEAVFPELARELVRNGGELLVNLTNDGWYGRSAAPYQHLAMARWRAVENRRYLLRAANSGVSAVIAPTGRIERRTDLFAREVCLGRFAFLSGRTLYASRGDACAIVCAIIALGVSAAGAWKRCGPKRL